MEGFINPARSCPECGMELQVTADCGCKEPSMVHFHCCGQELQKA